MNGREFAESVGLNPKWLRELIRRHGLMPSHVRWAEYEIDADDRDRILRHPAVFQAMGNRGSRLRRT